MIRKLSLLLLIIIGIQSIRAQEYFFRNYSVRDGMPQSSAFCLMQDSRGFIWAGTSGVGATIFDGSGFSTITKDDGLSGNTVRKIFEDSRGNIWFATETGVTVFDGYSMRIINHED